MDNQADQEPRTGLTPHLTIRDGRAAEAIEFYAKAFGATEHIRVPADDKKRLMHAHLTVNDTSLMLHDDFPEHRGGGEAPAPAGVLLHLQVDDADKWFNAATAAGAEVVLPIGDQFWGDRYGQVRDPFGHLWSIGCPIKK
ncbi:VOC family protein [Sphingomonas tabacisoli]|uniref:VOC family protein n=1 Tax=Sphingomonas tabacisoli TaxID=2249466 RepID=A0ABW4HX62_9SPHN